MGQFSPLTWKNQGLEKRRGKVALTLVWHQCIRKLVAPHISSGVGGLRCPQAAGKEGIGQAGVFTWEDPHPSAGPRPGWHTTHSERLRTLPRTDAPYLQSLSRANPKPCSDRSIQRWAHTWRAHPRPTWWPCRLLLLPSLK